MSVHHEIMKLEELLREAELGPNPQFFADVLDDEMLMEGQRAKDKIVAAHQPGQGQKFTRVQMSERNIVEHGPGAAVVTCKGVYEGPQGEFTLRFQRVWLKKDGRWKIIAASLVK